MSFASNLSRVIGMLGFGLVMSAMSQLRWRFVAGRAAGRHFYWATSLSGLPLIGLALGLWTGHWEFGH